MWRRESTSSRSTSHKFEVAISSALFNHPRMAAKTPLDVLTPLFRDSPPVNRSHYESWHPYWITTANTTVKEA
jgi:hypothetical protein